MEYCGILFGETIHLWNVNEDVSRVQICVQQAVSHDHLEPYVLPASDDEVS